MIKGNTPKKVRASKSNIGVEKNFKNATRLNKKVVSKGFVTRNPAEIWNRYPLLSANRTLMQAVKDVKKNGVIRGRIAIGFDKQILGRKVPEIRFNLVYYPKEEHIANFRIAQRNLRQAGPSAKFPGAVGSIRAVLRKKGPNVRLHIYDVQALYKVGGSRNVTHGIASKYWGWREELLKTLFDYIEKEKVTHITYTDENPGEFSSREKSINNRQEAFTKLAEAQGFKVTKTVYQNITGSSVLSGLEIVATKA